MKRVFPSISLNLSITALCLSIVSHDHSRKQAASRSTKGEYHWEGIWDWFNGTILGKTLATFSHGLISCSPKSTACYIAGPSSDKPWSCWWAEGFLLVIDMGLANQNMIDLVKWFPTWTNRGLITGDADHEAIGCCLRGCSPWAERAGFVQMVTDGYPGHPYSTQLHLIQQCLGPLTPLTPGTVKRKPNRILSLHEDIVLIGHDTTKPIPDLGGILIVPVAGSKANRTVVH